MILLLKACRFVEPLVAKFQATGFRRHQIFSKSEPQMPRTFQIFMSRMTPLLILLNEKPWGRLTCCMASHHCDMLSLGESTRIRCRTG